MMHDLIIYLLVLMIIFYRVSSKGANPCHLVIYTEKKILFSSNYCSGTVSVYKLLSDGTLDESTQVITYNPSLVTSCDVSNSSHIHEVTFSSNNSLLIDDLGYNKIYHYEMNYNKIQINPIPLDITLLPIGSGPRHIAIHPFYNYAFQINELDNTICTMSYNRNSGSIRLLFTITTLRLYESNEDMAAGEIQISLNGLYVNKIIIIL